MGWCNNHCDSSYTRNQPQQYTSFPECNTVLKRTIFTFFLVGLAATEDAGEGGAEIVWEVTSSPDLEAEGSEGPMTRCTAEQLDWTP